MMCRKEASHEVLPDVCRSRIEYSLLAKRETQENRAELRHPSAMITLQGQV